MKQQTKITRAHGKNTSELVNLLALTKGHVPQLGVVAQQPPMLSHQRGVNFVLPAIHGLARSKVRSKLWSFEPAAAQPA